MESEGITATAKDAAIYVKNSSASDDFVAAEFWVDDRVAIGSERGLANLLKIVDVTCGITGPAEAKWHAAGAGPALTVQSRSPRRHLPTLPLLAPTSSRSPRSVLRTCPVESHYTGLEEDSRGTGLPSRVRYARYDLLRTQFTTTS